MRHRVLFGLLALGMFASNLMASPVVSESHSPPNQGDVPASQILTSETEPPPLMINGTAGSVKVEAGTLVVAETSHGAEIAVFADASCSGVPVGDWRATDYPILVDDALTIYFQARWVPEPTVVSACLRLQWLNEPPTLTLNRVSTSLIVPVGTQIKLVHSENAELGQFSTEGCAGDPDWNEWSSDRNGIELTSVTPQTTFWMARRIDKPELTSPCLATTWFREDTGPPVLTVNDGTEPVSVPVGTPVRFDFPPGASLLEFGDTGCIGESYRTFVEIQELTHEEAGSRSYLAAWTEDDSQRSACIDVTWIDQPLMGQPPPSDTEHEEPPSVQTPFIPGSGNQVTALPSTGTGHEGSLAPVWALPGSIIVFTVSVALRSVHNFRC